LETRRIPFGEATFNSLYARYKASANIRNIEFKITKNQFKDLINQNCFYCGKEPSQRLYSKHQNGDCIYNGIDRVDSLKGYNMDNVVSCCGRCNEAKMELPQKEFFIWIEKIYKNIVDKNLLK
jgi:hypothetical protein